MTKALALLCAESLARKPIEPTVTITLFDKSDFMPGGEAMGQTAKDLPGLRPLDADRIEQELRLTVRISERKLTGIDTDDCDSAIANDLAAHLGQESQDALKAVRARLLYHQEQAAKACGGLDFEKEKHEIEGLQSEIRVAIESDRDDLSYTYEQYKGARAHFDKYRSARGLIAPAQKGEAPVNTISFLAILIVVESFFNAIFLAPVDPQGYLWGGFSAVLLAIVGVLVGYGTGFGTKNANSKWLFVRFIGVVVFVVGTLFLLFFHYFVMKYRSEMSLLGEQIEGGAEYMSLSELLSRTIASIVDAPFSVNDFNSLVIFLVGIIMGFLALQKGFSLGDRYPGYTAQRARFDQVREQYIERRNGHLVHLEGLRQAVIESIRGFIEDAERGRKLATNYANSSTDLLQSYRTFEQSVRSTAQHITTRYVADISPKKRSRVREFIEKRVMPTIDHDDDLQSLVDDIREVARLGKADAEDARGRADDLRSRTIDAIDQQIAEFKGRFADAT